MEDQPLNRAHQQHRRAESHLKYKRFDEAMQCHHNATELLLDAMKSTSSARALDSIALQHSYHLKQKDLIKAKKEQFERVKRAMNNLKHLSQDPVAIVSQQHDSNIQIAIYRAIQEADSLLGILRNPNDSIHSDILSDENVAVATDALAELNAPASPGEKKPKDQQTIIEELQTLSQSLHALVDKLVMQIEVFKDENTNLKERVEFLENERRKYLNMNGDLLNSTCPNDFGTVTNVDYSPEDNSDFAYPPTEFRAESTDCDSELPTPLDKPNFDLTAFRDDVGGS